VRRFEPKPRANDHDTDSLLAHRHLSDDAAGDTEELAQERVLRLRFGNRFILGRPALPGESAQNPAQDTLDPGAQSADPLRVCALPPGCLADGDGGPLRTNPANDTETNDSEEPEQRWLRGRVVR
jgi:hypothetical protein